MRNLPQNRTTGNKPDRIERGLLLASNPDRITQTSRDHWTVKSDLNAATSYSVTPAGCTCPDARKGFICKHTWAVYLIASATVARMRRTPSIEAADALLESFHLAAGRVPQAIKMTVRLEHERTLARLDGAHSQTAQVSFKRECAHRACNSSRCAQASYYEGIAV